MSRVRPLLLSMLVGVTACAGGYRATAPYAVEPVEYAGPPGLTDARLDGVHASLARDPEQRRLDRALRARADLRARLVALGAIPRPPMPAPLAEEPGSPPFPGAIWVAGRWVWTDGRWEWRSGYWTDPAGDDGNDVLIGVSTGVGVGVDSSWFGSSDGDFSNLRDHRTDDDDKGATIRDHRDDDTTTTTIRDHRNSDAMPATVIRDGGDNNRDKDSGSRIRDHRDDDRGSRIRDHRR